MKNIRKSPIILAILVIALIVAGIVVIKIRGPHFPIYATSVEVSDTAPCRATTGTLPKNVFGIGVIPFDSLHDPQVLEALEELGAKWIRTDFNWRYLEPEPGVINEEVLRSNDTLVERLTRKNISIQVIINNAPDWAKMQDWDYFAEHAALFAGTLVDRYKPSGTLAKERGLAGGIRVWEIFNEPNFPCCGWLEQNMGPIEAEQFTEEYVHVLAEVNARIRRSDPSAVILLGGLSDNPTYASNPESFLRKVYELGGKSCFDVIALHPYEQIGKFKEAKAAMSAIADAYGDGSKPLWFNEFGSPHENQQEDVFRKAASEAHGVPFFIWFSLKDFNFREQFGLLRSDNSRRPVFYLMKEALKTY